jgi:hypothetical protein
MEAVGKSSYSPSVAQLLTCGKPEGAEAKDWPDYLALGLGPENIPALIAMATDEDLNNADEESLEVWAPVHAWRTLGQLHADDAIEPLLALFKLQADSEWVIEELPEVYGMLGPAALPALTTFISDAANDEWPRVIAVNSIEKIAQYTPDARTMCVEILSRQLEQFQAEEYEFNAALVHSLVELQAKEAAPLIERAMAADAVETFLMGDWEDIQEALGLLSPEELEKLQQRRQEEQNARMAFLENPLQAPSLSPGSFPMVSASDVEVSRSRGTAVKKSKQRQKMAKQSRKKNRKR